MFIRKGLKGLLCATLVCLMGCSQASGLTGPIKVLSPTGAPALSTLGLQDESSVQVDYVQGQDVLVSELNKADSEYSMMIAPVNLGVKSWQQAQTWQLAGVVTWGNLYIVSDQENWNVEGNTLAAFGEGAIPQMVFNRLFPEVKCNVTFYPSVAEANQALVSGQANAALLAQPVATASIAKCKEAGKTVSIVNDLQSMWQEANKTSQKGYPQAGVFVKKGVDVQKALSAMSSFLDKAEPAVLKERIEKVGVDTLGVPSVDIAVSTWNAQNIHFKTASESKEDLKTFLDTFNLKVSDDMLKSE